MAWFPCCTRDSQQSSTAPGFESINSSVLNLLYGPFSHLYMTTGKTIAFTRQTFVGKVISLLFNRYWTNINFLVFKTIIIVVGDVNIRGSWARWWILENSASFCKSSVILKWSQNRKSKKVFVYLFSWGLCPLLGCKLHEDRGWEHWCFRHCTVPCVWHAEHAE